MTRACLAFALCLVASFAAADDKAATIPLPAALVAAKTVYVTNTGAPNKAVENTLKALNGWKRWAIVANAAEADITLTISVQPTTQVYNWALGTNMALQSQFLAITDPAGTNLFGTVFTRLDPKKELEKLRKRLDSRREP